MGCFLSGLPISITFFWLTKYRHKVHFSVMFKMGQGTFCRKDKISKQYRFSAIYMENRNPTRRRLSGRNCRLARNKTATRYLYIKLSDCHKMKESSKIRKQTVPQLDWGPQRNKLFILY